MGKQPDGCRSYELDWHFSDRVATEHLGSQKYSTSTKAIRELVANALDADATVVNIEVHENELGGIDSVVVTDNGRGLSPKVLRERFVDVGVEPSSKLETHLGRFGVGRLAVHRIGTLSEWTTVVDAGDGGRVRSTFTLQAGELRSLKITEERVPRNTPCGTAIRIVNIRDRAQGRLTPGSISSDLLSHFCSYLLANPSRRVSVQDEPLDVHELIENEETETIPASELVPQDATLKHLLLYKPVDQSRFQAQVVFSAKGRTIATAESDSLPSRNYLGIVECAYLDSIVTSNRELLIEMDEGFTQLRDSALGRMREFGKRLRTQRKRAFVEKARQEDYYPFPDPPTDPIGGMKQAMYDVVLEKVNEAANVENMTKRQQEVVFRLLKRSLDNENVLEVLHEVASLSDEDMEKFRKLLERTTLDAIIKLSSEVVHRLDFLDVFHGLVYGEVAKHLQERSQLHRILESECWIFGAQFHLATSDKSFRQVIRKHRVAAGLDDIGDDVVRDIKGVADIPDLFLAATRDYPVDPNTIISSSN